MRDRMAEMVYRVQDIICDKLAEFDDVEYREDVWDREEGGGGRWKMDATASHSMTYATVTVTYHAR